MRLGKLCKLPGVTWLVGVGTGFDPRSGVPRSNAALWTMAGLRVGACQRRNTHNWYGGQLGFSVTAVGGASDKEVKSVFAAMGWRGV